MKNFDSQNIKWIIYLFSLWIFHRKYAREPLGGHVKHFGGKGARALQGEDEDLPVDLVEAGDVHHRHRQADPQAPGSRAVVPRYARLGSGLY